MVHAPAGLLHVKVYCSRKESCVEARTRPADVSSIPDDLLFVAGEHDSGPQRFVVADHLIRKKAEAPSEKRAEPPVIRFHAGRPRVDELLEAEIQACAPTDWVRQARDETPLTAQVAVGVCGPTSLGQAVCESTYKAIHPSAVLRGEKRRNVHLELEQFGW